MSGTRLVLTRAAQRGLGRISPKLRAALMERLEAIAAQPFARHPNVERIKGERDAFRRRQGDGEPSIGSIAGRARCASWSWSREGACTDDDVRAIRPLAEDGDTVLLRRADYEALVREAEDAADAAQIRAAEARVAAGDDEYVPIEVTRRLMAGEVPVRVWREHRGLSARALAASGRDLGRLSQPDRDRQEARLVRRHGQARPRARRRHGGSGAVADVTCCWDEWLPPRTAGAAQGGSGWMSMTYRSDALAAIHQTASNLQARASWPSGSGASSTSLSLAGAADDGDGRPGAARASAEPCGATLNVTIGWISQRAARRELHPTGAPLRAADRQ